MSRFCGLRSRCNIRILWQYVRPLRWFFKVMPTRGRSRSIRITRLKTCLSSWNKNIRTLFIASLTPLISSIYCFKSRSRYSNTKVKQLCVWIISWRVTIFACFNPRSNDTKIYCYQLVTNLVRCDEVEMADLKVADVHMPLRLTLYESYGMIHKLWAIIYLHV